MDRRELQSGMYMMQNFSAEEITDHFRGGG